MRVADLPRAALLVVHRPEHSMIASHLFSSTDQEQDTDAGSTAATHGGRVEASGEQASAPVEREAATFSAEADPQTLRRRVFYLALASHYGHARIARIAEDETTRMLAEAIARQRYTQCRAIAAITFPDGQSRSASPEEAREVQSAWTRAGHALSQGDLPGFRDQLSGAESQLEDALLEAATTLRDEAVAHQFLDFSLAVYGARLRWEELCGRHCASAQASW